MQRGDPHHKPIYESHLRTQTPSRTVMVNAYCMEANVCLADPFASCWEGIHLQWHSSAWSSNIHQYSSHMPDNEVVIVTCNSSVLYVHYRTLRVQWGVLQDCDSPEVPSITMYAWTDTLLSQMGVVMSSPDTPKSIYSLYMQLTKPSGSTYPSNTKPPVRTSGLACYNTQRGLINHQARGLQSVITKIWQSAPVGSSGQQLPGVFFTPVPGAQQNGNHSFWRSKRFILRTPD